MTSAGSVSVMGKKESMELNSVEGENLAEWTFIAYIDGDNDLEKYLVNTFLDMADADYTNSDLACPICLTYVRDLYAVAKYFSINSNDECVIDSAKNLMSCIEECVIERTNGGNDPKLNGIGIYFTNKKGIYTAKQENYEQLDLAENTDWDEFLHEHFSRTKCSQQLDNPLFPQLLIRLRNRFLWLEQVIQPIFDKIILELC